MTGIAPSSDWHCHWDGVVQGGKVGVALIKEEEELNVIR
jgi:hypothetical protein